MLAIHKWRCPCYVQGVFVVVNATSCRPLSAPHPTPTVILPLPQVAVLMASFARAGYGSRHLFYTLARMAVRRAEELTPNEVSLMLPSLARVRVRHDALFDIGCSMVCNRSHDFAPRQLADVMWAVQVGQRGWGTGVRTLYGSACMGRRWRCHVVVHLVNLRWALLRLRWALLRLRHLISWLAG